VRLKGRIDEARDRVRRRVASMGADGADQLDQDIERVLELRERLLSLATDTGPEISAALRAGRRVLLEGAQGTALDLDHGTYPFVTSSNTTAAAAATGTGIGPTAIDAVVGVVKAYTTRVGEGPLPSAMVHEMDEHVRKLGGAFGATTGRPRRCGWFDSVLTRYAAQVNGLTGIAVTKLDVLDTLTDLQVATGYRLPDGSVTESFPADVGSLGAAVPVYETLPGWEASTAEARKLADLPTKARAYLDRIEELTGAPVQWVSVGTRRDQIIPVA
jgi:adenylosuccinate synthase